MHRLVLKEPKLCAEPHPVLPGVARARKVPRNPPRATCSAAPERLAVRPVTPFYVLACSCAKGASNTSTLDPDWHSKPGMLMLELWTWFMNHE